MNPLFRGKVEKGKLILEDPYRYLAYLSKFEGKEVAVSFKRWRENRSDQQNKYYWGVIIEILSQHLGYMPEELHETLKHKFLSEKAEDAHGLIRVKSTAKLETDEFIQYTNQIVMWAARDLNVFIPDPGSVVF